MMADFCWLLLRETPDEKYAEQHSGKEETGPPGDSLTQE